MSGSIELSGENYCQLVAAAEERDQLKSEVSAANERWKKLREYVAYWLKELQQPAYNLQRWDELDDVRLEMDRLEYGDRNH
jgi:hypothetical protein